MRNCTRDGGSLPAAPLSLLQRREKLPSVAALGGRQNSTECYILHMKKPGLSTGTDQACGEQNTDPTMWTSGTFSHTEPGPYTPQWG